MITEWWMLITDWRMDPFNPRHFPRHDSANWIGYALVLLLGLGIWLTFSKRGGNK